MAVKKDDIPKIVAVILDWMNKDIAVGMLNDMIALDLSNQSAMETFKRVRDKLEIQNEEKKHGQANEGSNSTSRRRY